MPDATEIVARIRAFHRRRRFAMKVQQKLDRSLESFIRINATDWNPNDDETERAKANREVKALIAAIRKGEDHQFAADVFMCDAGREPADRQRALAEREMEKAAKELAVFPWLESIRGAGALGLATIVAETGDLSLYATPAKVWKRLGFAPYDGHAGSTWKRSTSRPRTLTSEEWIANPFSGERYALMAQIALWLVNAQWIGAAKSDSGEGQPNGPYGEVYAARREHTLQTRPDWSDGHRRKDALRFAMKRFLLDLLREWHKAYGRRIAPDLQSPGATVAPGQHDVGLPAVRAGRSPKRGRQRPGELQETDATAAPGPGKVAPQTPSAGRSNLKRGRLPVGEIPAVPATAAPGHRRSELQRVRAGRSSPHGDVNA